MNGYKVTQRIAEFFPDHTISNHNGLHSITPQWNWLAGKPKKYGNFFTVEIDANLRPAQFKLIRVNTRIHSMMIMFATYAIVGIGWGEWVNMLICLALLFGVVSWYYRRERDYYQKQARLVIENINFDSSSLK